MKTVQDYLDLGLVFVSGDKICRVTSDSSSGEVDIFDRAICPRQYSKGAAKIGVDYYARARWTPSSFAWRNNDGVKPKYNGDVEIMDGERNTGIRKSSKVNWAINPHAGDANICKWRPVVLQSELPAVLLKEDKPMKPVYTAEMHARNELPPIGSMVLVDAEAESGVKYKDHPTILADVSGELPQLKVMAILTSDVGRRVAVLQNKNNECHCFKLSSVRPISPVTKTIKVNGFDVPAPMSEAPEHRQMVYLASSAHIDFNLDFTWQDDEAAVRWLSRGLIHATKSAAIAHAKSMLGINPNPSRGGDGYDRNVLGQNNEGDEL